MEMRRMLVTMTVVLGSMAVVAGVAWQVWGSGDWGGPATVSPRPARQVSAGDLSTERAVVATWDRQRSRAWASADVDRLARLYRPGAAAGRRDVRMLKDYDRRGLVVRGMRMQVLAFEVRRSDRRRLVVDVTDRLVGAQVVHPGGRVRALPRDQATERRLTLVRQQGRWVMGSVR